MLYRSFWSTVTSYHRTPLPSTRIWSREMKPALSLNRAAFLSVHPPKATLSMTAAYCRCISACTQGYLPFGSSARSLICTVPIQKQDGTFCCFYRGPYWSHASGSFTPLLSADTFLHSASSPIPVLPHNLMHLPCLSVVIKERSSRKA